MQSLLRSLPGVDDNFFYGINNNNLVSIKEWPKSQKWEEPSVVYQEPKKLNTNISETEKVAVFWKKVHLFLDQLILLDKICVSFPLYVVKVPLFLWGLCIGGKWNSFLMIVVERSWFLTVILKSSVCFRSKGQYLSSIVLKSIEVKTRAMEKLNYVTQQ